MKKTALRTLGITWVAATLAACAVPPPTPLLADASSTGALRAPAPKGQLERIRNTGVLRVGVIPIPPWAMPDKTGQWIGLDIDIANRLAADVGVRAEFVRMSWDGAADDVASGIVDLAVGLWPGPQRGLVVNFSQPYSITQFGLLGNRSKAEGLKSLADFDKPAVKVGAQRGSLAENVARQSLKKATVVLYGNGQDLFTALQAGELTAAVLRTPALDLLAKADPKTFVLPLREPMAQRSEVFAVARGEGDFLSYLNTWVRYQDEIGWLPERRQHWLTSVDWQNQL